MPFEPGGNFNDRQELKYNAHGKLVVNAKGPLTPKADLKEICIWVFQRRPGEANDVAATEMTTTLKDRDMEFHQDPLGGQSREWNLQAGRIDDGSTEDLQAGPAVAMAIALFKIDDTTGQLKVQQWAQSVDLYGPTNSPPAAQS
jgi:hypothetical protein